MRAPCRARCGALMALRDGARGAQLSVPVYGPRAPQGSLPDPCKTYLQARLAQYPGLSGSRLLREIQAQGYTADTRCSRCAVILVIYYGVLPGSVNRATNRQANHVQP